MLAMLRSQAHLLLLELFSTVLNDSKNMRDYVLLLISLFDVLVISNGASFAERKGICSRDSEERVAVAALM